MSDTTNDIPLSTPSPAPDPAPVEKPVSPAKQYVKSNRTGMIIVIVFLVGAVIMFFVKSMVSSHNAPPPSAIKVQPPQINTTTGGVSTPEYNRLAEQNNRAGYDRAKSLQESGKEVSFTPTPVGGNESTLHLDPLKVATPPADLAAQRQAEEVKQQQIAAAAQAPAGPSDQEVKLEAQKQALLPSYQAYVNTVLGTSNSGATVYASIAANAATTTTPNALTADGQPRAASMAPATPAAAPVTRIKGVANKILYSISIMAASSDHLGAMTVKVLQQPLSGAILTCKPTTSVKDMMIACNKMEYKNVFYTVDAIAVDPNTMLPAVTGDVDSHTMQRYGGLLGAAFLGAASGYGQAMAQPPQTISQGIGSTIMAQPAVTQSEAMAQALSQGSTQVATTVGSSLAQAWSTPDTISLRPDLPMGILFLSDPASTDAPEPTAAPKVPSAPTKPAA